jgi:hypothetical protein
VALEAASPRPRFTGTASDVADGLQLWFEQRAADGFIIQGGTPETFRALWMRWCRCYRRAVCSVATIRAPPCGKVWVWRYPLINSKNNKRESRYAENNTLAGRRVGI